MVLSRLLNNKTDKSLREKYRLIAKNQSPYFPIDSVGGFQSPVLVEIIKMSRRAKELPFKKAIHEFKAIMGSGALSPLDKLYKL